MTNLKIDYEPYRGKCEPVTMCSVARLVFHTNYLEIRVAYDFEYKDEDTNKILTHEVRFNCFIPKQGIFLERSIYTHTPNDKTHVLKIDSPSMTDPFWIWAKEDEIKTILDTLKTWVL